MKLYLLDWGNGMIGGFDVDTLTQTFNTTKDTLFYSLKHITTLYKVSTLEIEFIESYEKLDKMRLKRQRICTKLNRL